MSLPRLPVTLGEARAAARAFWVRLYAPVLIHTRPLPEVLRRLDRSDARARGAAAPLDPRTLPAVERAVAALRVIPNTCLYRSLARYNVLSGREPGLRFVMGVRKDGPQLVGHAWLERDGKPLGEALDPRLVVTFSYPPS